MRSEKGSQKSLTVPGARGILGRSLTVDTGTGIAPSVTTTPNQYLTSFKGDTRVPGARMEGLLMRRSVFRSNLVIVIGLVAVALVAPLLGLAYAQDLGRTTSGSRSGTLPCYWASRGSWGRP